MSGIIELPRHCNRLPREFFVQPYIGLTAIVAFRTSASEPRTELSWIASIQALVVANGRITVPLLPATLDSCMNFLLTQFVRRSGEAIGHGGALRPGRGRVVPRSGQLVVLVLIRVGPADVEHAADRTYATSAWLPVSVTDDLPVGAPERLGRRRYEPVATAEARQAGSRLETAVIKIKLFSLSQSNERTAGT
ncbi:MAG: hypothetical protein J2P23_13875 [Microlunatus sp.]|nr:hypothetical protein [Microlunatus sp.]